MEGLGSKRGHRARKDRRSRDGLSLCTLLLCPIIVQPDVCLGPRRALADPFRRFSSPTSPITYFPNPSSFQANIPLSPSASMSSRPASTSASSTDDEDVPRTRRTPKAGGALKYVDSSSSSPRMTQRSQTMDSGPGSSRRISTSSHATVRTLSTPVEGYGATHQTNPVLSGLGLGQPDQGPGAPIRRGRDDVLASPRRISTSSPVPPNINVGTASTRHRSPGTAVTHEAYYSQPSTASTPQFKHSRKHYAHAHGYGHSRNASLSNTGAGIVNSSYLSASTSAHSGLHHRNLSVQTADLALGGLRSHSMKSPTNSVFRRLRKTASAVGLSVGRPEEYDADPAGGDEAEEGIGAEDESVGANGRRVWYR